MKKNIKKATLESISSSLESVASSIEELALITAKGFENTSIDIAKLEQGQEGIKLRLDNVAYRFDLWNYRNGLIGWN